MERGEGRGWKGETVFTVGLVKTQDAANCRVRVIFPHRSQMQSYWLPVLVPKSQNDKAYWMPDIGEMVVCLMDQHFEDGAVLGAIYSSTDTPPASSADKYHWTFKDGATFDYDRAAHVLAITLGASATMTITAHGATIQIDASGNINLTAAGNINLVTNSHIDSVNGIINTYNSHTHPDPQGGNTSTPTQQMA
jgi:phage baseplate assembly protein V